MRIALIANEKAAEAKSLYKRVFSTLEELGAEVLTPPAGTEFPLNATDELISACAMVVVLGGDGTIIHTAKRAANFNRPVLGINCGQLGFMAGLECDELSKLSALMNGHYTIEKRMMLNIEINSSRGNKTTLHALNEAVVARGALSKMVEFEVSSEREHVLAYRADGIIIATPTGSTAYSLSAGGPIIDPGVRCLLMTPICAHSLHARSYIFDENSQIYLKTKNIQEQEVFLIVDGEEGLQIRADDVLVISRSEIFASLIIIDETPFYQVLNKKLISRH
ncbi:MAG: NAD(+)/NADH kinase [Oscillospiraceae bacterium]|nr:NAD(+)/NADH kinase [Oscillospiraceae bacterium]MDD3832487.1 NAD(+)/NADH kinase [Oscillospiraceae bacterium]MDD4546369.1 NAD(+)/NADH kinase [Oscillospiraceae bacterium]